MTTRLSMLTYAQRWDGAALHLRVLLIPRGSPLEPLSPGEPAFADARFVFDVHVVAGLDSLPVSGGSGGTVIGMPEIIGARALFESLAKTYPIDPAPPPANPRRAGTRIRKHLPSTYLDAVSYASPRSPYVSSDDTYACALNAPPPKPYVKLPPPNPVIPWGKVVAFLLRRQILAEAAGLVRVVDVEVDPRLLVAGGFVHTTLSPSGDGAGLLGSPDALKVYAARLPAMTAARGLFTPVLFPVASTPPPLDYDELFAEAEDYHDGFAKAVHCAQPRQFDPLDEKPDGTRPVKELGIRIGWDDEQVTTWLNRQIDPASASLDAPMGVQGYRIDAREKGSTAWQSLVRASGPVQVNDIDLGVFVGELGVETHPVQLHAQATEAFWLPAYFTAWTGPSLVTLDAATILLAGGPDRRVRDRIVGTPPDIALHYGHDYEFRVRLMDHTSAGPRVDDAPLIPGPAPSASLAFRRWVRPARPVLIDPPPPDPDPSAAPNKLKLRRPLLGHPAVVLTGAYANAVDLLVADLPRAAAEHREVGLRDPDVDAVRIVVEARGLAQDPLASDGGYVILYETTRDFPAAPLDAPLVIDLAWTDVHDASTLTVEATGPLVLPTARDVRLRIASRGREDRTLAYFGADDVRFSPPVSVALRNEAAIERDLFAPDLPTQRLRALFLQPDPAVDAALLFAQRAGGRNDVRPSDAPSRLAAELGLRNDAATFRARPGRRVVFGCASTLRHLVGPDAASLTFASQSDLVKHWIIVIRLTLDRDWTWDGLAHDGLVVERDGIEVGRFAPGRSAGVDALDDPSRNQTDLVFFDAIDPKPAPGVFPDVLHVHYALCAELRGKPAHDDALAFDIDLPVTTPPSQRPRLVSAGIAMSPYARSADYASTGLRRRVLWLELDRPPDDPHDAYFARVLRVAPDPLLSTLGEGVAASAEPPLAVDPEWIRAVVEGQSDDRAGLDAMQPLIASDSPVHFMLPLPPGSDEQSPELFGFFTYELRVGHACVWSTAQGRYGAPLRVAGVQHPSPSLTCAVMRNENGITASAPFALPVFESRSVQARPPKSQMWVLLYAQATQIDGADRRNVLLARKPAPWSDRTFGDPSPAAVGNATFTDDEVRRVLQALAFSEKAPLSVLAVELLPNGVDVVDPLGVGLGAQRILRTSPLVPVPGIC